MTRRLFSFLALAALMLALFTIIPSMSVLAQCGGKGDPACPPPDGGKHKRPTPTPYPSKTPIPQAPAATSAPIPAPLDNPKPAAPPSGGPSVLDFIGQHLVLDGILIALLVGVLIGLSRGILIGLNRGRSGFGVGDAADDASTRFVKLTEGSVVESHPHLSTATQVSEVHVKGYDPEHKKDMVGTATPDAVLGHVKLDPIHQKADQHVKHNEDAIKEVEVEVHVEDIHNKFA